MSEDVLVALRSAKDATLDLFSEYFILAFNCKEAGDKENFRYWLNRASDVSKENHKIESDIRNILKGERVL